MKDLDPDWVAAVKVVSDRQRQRDDEADIEQLRLYSQAQCRAYELAQAELRKASAEYEKKYGVFYRRKA